MTAKSIGLVVGFALVALTSIRVCGVTKDDYEMKFTVVVRDGVGTKSAQDAVIPIRLSETLLSGFKYSDFKELDGTDLYVVDESDAALDYEIDMWNPAGETTLWVKVPSIAAHTVLSVYYKGAKNTDNTPRNVWSRFLGVWHLNDDGVKVDGDRTQSLDASGNGLHATNTVKTSSVAGFFGKARQPRTSNNNNSGVGGIFLPYVELPASYVLSGYFKVNSFFSTVMFSTKKKMSDKTENGLRFGFRMTWNNGQVNVAGDGMDWGSINNAAGDVTQWNHNTFIVNSGKMQYYRNGTYIGSVNGSVTDTGKPICVGNASSAEAYDDKGEDNSWIGQMDEIRIQSYANFDADREYFEGAIATDATLIGYTPAAPCTSLAVDLTFNVIKSMNPAEISFAAEVLGATGECTYSWDFDNDGTVDRVSTSATETWICTKAGEYNARVQVKDAKGVTGEITTLSTYIVNDTLYADGEATEDGYGAQESPFNNLRSLAVRMRGGDIALLRGTFIVGDEAEAITFAEGNIQIGKWGDEKPFVKSTNETYVAKSGILVFEGSNVLLSDFAFEFTKESFTGVNAVFFKGNNVSVERCDFSAAGGACAQWKGYKGVLGMGNSQCSLLVRNCTFRGFRAGNNDCCAVSVGKEATILECVFEDVSVAIRANNDVCSDFNFISNIVINAESEDLASEAAGVVIKGGWSKFNPSTIAYNRFVNTNCAARAGCVVYCRSKTGQNGIIAHHNTVVGYKTFAYFDSTTCEPWTFSFFNNLVVGCNCFFMDEKKSATYATQKDGCIRNNYHEGVLSDVPDGYSYNARMTVDGNVLLTAVPKFVNVQEKTSLDFYRTKIGNKRDPLMVGGWTDGGKYPAYIGAVSPIVMGGTVILVK